MLQTILSGLTSLVGGWFELKKSSIQAEVAYNQQQLTSETDWDLEAMRQARYSWKDEFITFIWFLPLLVAWLYPDEASAWVDFVDKLPSWYQIGMFGIMAASFGLRWLFKQQSLNIAKGKVDK